MACAAACRAPLVHSLRLHASALLAGCPYPHDELLALVWGPRFDRVHGLALLARHAECAAQALPALLQAADCFDALGSAQQERVRQTIQRHRARHGGVTMSAHAPHPAH